MVEGELWRAHAVEGVIEAGEDVEVVAEDHLTLLVRKPAQPSLFSSTDLKKE